jgi:hypothetical protein
VLTFGLNFTDENGLSRSWVVVEHGYPGVFQVGVTVAGGQMTPVLTLLPFGLCFMSEAFKCLEPDSEVVSICATLSAAKVDAYCADAYSFFHPVKTIEIVTQPGVHCKDDEEGMRMRPVPNYFGYTGPAYEPFTQCRTEDCEFALVRKFCPRTCRVCLDQCEDKETEALQMFNVTCNDVLSLGLCTRPLSAHIASESCPLSCGKCRLAR